MPGQHSRLSPSSSHRWRRCAGSVHAEDGLDKFSGREAAEGTVFHSFAACCVETGLDPENFVGRKLTAGWVEIDSWGNKNHIEKPIEFDQDMCDSMKGGLHRVDELLRGREGTQLFVEQQVDLSPWFGEGEFGTSDIIVVDVASRHITVGDWKYGRVRVDPHKNDQATAYFLGAWNTFLGKIFDNNSEGITVDIWIEQPRVPGGGGTWTTTVRNLLKEGEQFKLDAEATIPKDAKRTAGQKQCQYCVARSVGCKTYNEFAVSLMNIKFEDMNSDFDFSAHLMKMSESVSSEKRSVILLNRKLIIDFMDRLQEQAISDYERGRPTPGQKLVQGRAPARKFRENAISRVETILKELLGDKAFETKMITPAVAEKQLGKGKYGPLLAEFVLSGAKKPILVPDSDGREAISSQMSKYDGLVIESF